MKEFKIIKKQLSINSLMMQISVYDTKHRFDAQSGKTNNTFGYIESGSAVFTTPKETVEAKEGDFIFIPESLRYYSMWSGNARICFYNLHFRSEITDTPFWANLALQRIAEMSNQETADEVHRLYELAGGDDSDQLAAYGGYYNLISRALPYMRKNTTGDLPEALVKAIAYIENNCINITSVSEISKYCFISESRLYHLFSKHLHTTPITYLNRNRILMALEMLKHTDDSLNQIADKLNFHSEYYFRKTFKQITGVLPSDFRKLRK